MIVIGDYSWVLTAIISTLAVLLTVYFLGLLVVSTYHRNRTAQKASRRASAKGLSSGRGAIQTP
jgi:hypothetical protein